MKSTFKDLTGKTFGRLKVLYLDESTIHDRKKKWICECSCGNIKSIRGDALSHGRTKSCGCIAIEKSSVRMKQMSEKPNEYIIDGKYVFIKATNSDDIIVIDKDDLELVLQHHWYVTKDKYAKTNFENKHTIQMHKLITNTGRLEFVDHIKDFGNITRTLNNTKENLRIVTKSQNSMNRKLATNNRSGVPGVSFSRQRLKWRAYIKLNNKNISLGYFNCFEEAVSARKQAEETYFGEYSYSNSMYGMERNAN